MKTPRIVLKKILYPTDLSESGRHAFDYAASLANAYNAEITVLHVVEEGPDLDQKLVGYISEELWEEIKQRDLQEARDLLISRKRDDTAIKKVICDYCEDIQAGVAEEAYVTYDIAIEIGHAVEKILTYAESGGFDLIVLGRHGHDTLADAMLGTTARRVVRRTNIPVLTVRVPDDDD